MTTDDNITLSFYNTNAQQFSANTVAVEFANQQNIFLEHLPNQQLKKQDISILDFGCGSGRDTRYFLEQGYQVEATDGSEELCKIASAYAGVPVKRLLFQELDEENKYDGIWACSSILHLNKSDLVVVLGKMARALKNDGVIYTSFKYGNYEGIRNGRYFTDMTEQSFETLITNVQQLTIDKYWITTDVRINRADEKWLNLILRRK